MTNVKILITMLTVALHACSGEAMPDPVDGGSGGSPPDSGSGSVANYACTTRVRCNDGTSEWTVHSDTKKIATDDPRGYEATLMMTNCRQWELLCMRDAHTCTATCEATP